MLLERRDHRPDLSRESPFALIGLGLDVSDNLYLSEGFKASGAVSLTAAHVGQELHLDDACILGRGGDSLIAERLTVGGSMHCSEGFTARGSVNLADSRIAGRLDFTGAILDHPAGNTLDLRGVTAEVLVARPSAAPAVLDLRRASVTTLDDDPASWPARLMLRDFSYQTLGGPAADVRQRRRWLTRDVEDFVPQPYEQLAAVYRRAGRDEAARTIAMAKQRRRRKAINPAARVWSILLNLTIGYGYRTWLAGVWLLGLAIAGTIVFRHAYPAHMVAISSTPMPFNPIIYAVDVLLPIVDLGQQTSWQPRGPALDFYWALIALGWILTSALVAGLTGIFKQD